MMRIAVLLAFLACSLAHAHSASDAYLTLDVTPGEKATIVEGRWDIALRDLHFVLNLDDDGDGAITWGEVRRHQRKIEDYAYARLAASAGGTPCVITRGAQAVATRADGGYATLAFRIACPGKPRVVSVDYQLLFDVDPSHRGIVVLRAAGGVSTSVVSPAQRRIELPRS